MSKFSRNFLSLLLLLQLIITYSTYAAAVGEFTSVVGQVTQTRATEVIRPAAKSSIELEDLITTDRASSTSMVFSDDSTIMLAENTKLEIKEFLFKEKSRTGVFSLMIGKVTATVKKYIGGDNVFEVHSPTAVVGVRGTGFEFIEAARDGNVDSPVADQRMATVTCTDGSLTVSSLSATGAVISTMVIEAGQVAVIIGGVITLSKIGAAVVAAVGRATETGGAGAAGGTGTGGAAGGGSVASAGGTSGGVTATTAGTVTIGTGISTATTVGLAIGGVAVVGGAAAAVAGGAGGSKGSSGGSSGSGSGGNVTSQTIFETDSDCANLNNVRTGQAIVFQRGVGVWPTPDEKVKALAGHYAVITLDGLPLNVFYEGTTLHLLGYGDRARANWVATSGTHTVTAVWTVHPQNVSSCTFTISK